VTSSTSGPISFSGFSPTNDATNSNSFPWVGNRCGVKVLGTSICSATSKDSFEYTYLGGCCCTIRNGSSLLLVLPREAGDLDDFAELGDLDEFVEGEESKWLSDIS
jgi:hypothetical protein